MMTDTTTNPLGKGIQGSNCITFSSGAGVTNQVSRQITFAEIAALASVPQDVEKSRARWILPSSLPSRKAYEQQQNGKFGLLWADIDDMQGRTIDGLCEALGIACALIYATKSATQANQRCRIIIPLSCELGFTDWLICQNKLNSKISELGVEVDESNLKASQILFLPNQGNYYQSILPQTKKRGNPAQWIAQGKEEASPLTSMASISSIQPKVAKSGSVITQFKACFSVADILQLAGYKQNPHNPLQWRHPDSESGSYSASIDPVSGRVHSLSSRDPLYTGGGGQGAHDSFSVFCVLFCDGDMRKAVWRAANEWLAKEAAHG